MSFIFTLTEFNNKAGRHKHQKILPQKNIG